MGINTVHNICETVWLLLLHTYCLRLHQGYYIYVDGSFFSIQVLSTIECLVSNMDMARLSSLLSHSWVYRHYGFPSADCWRVFYVFIVFCYFILMLEFTFFRPEPFILWEKNYWFSSQVLVDSLPRKTLMWKLQMIGSASAYANSRLHAVKAQTLILSRFSIFNFFHLNLFELSDSTNLIWVH